MDETGPAERPAVSLQSLLTTLLLPPIAPTLLALAALLVLRRRRLGISVAVASLVVQLAAATPLVSGWLRASLEAAIETPPAAAPGAIVLLGGDQTRRRDGPDVGPLSLERIRAAAALQRRTGLPLLITGGPVSRKEPVPIAALMAASANADFGVPVRWVEPRARDTRENAAFSAPLLRADGIVSVWLVTHAWHMPRASAAFAREGIAVHPAPVPPGAAAELSATALVPSAHAALESWYAVREWLGIAVYRLRDGPARGATSVMKP